MPQSASPAARRRASGSPDPRSRPASIRSPLSAGARRLLAALAAPGAATRADPLGEDAVMVRGEAGGVALGRGRFPRSALAELRDHDLVRRPAEARNPERFEIAETGRAHLRRLASPDPEGGFAAQQRETEEAELPGEGGPARVLLHAGESPLAWLRRRRDRDGEPLIDAAAYEAGERLRRDLTFGGMLPSVTSRWEGAIGGAGQGGLRDPAGATDAALAARQRVRAALAAVGGDMAGLLVDLCGFLKGLELIERERGWPARSGKVAARLALGQLARHYGLGTEARGPMRSQGIRSWEATPAG